MSYLRTLYTDATARASNLSAVSTHVPGYLCGDDSRDHAYQPVMAVVSGAETNGLRKPSQRPLDQRWDLSRGLVFSQPRRTTSKDHTWSPNNGIKFSGNDQARRTYAMRPIGGPPPKPPTQTGSKPVYGSSAMPPLDRPPVPVGSAPTGSKQEQMERDIRAKDTQIQSLEAQRTSLEKQYQDSQAELRGLQHEMEERKEQIYKKGRADEASANAQKVASLEESLHNAERALNQAVVKISNLQKTIEQEQAARIKSVKSSEERLLSEKRRHADELQDRDDKHAKEVQRARDSSVKRKEQRTSYTSYREIFDNVHEDRVASWETSFAPLRQIEQALRKSQSLAKALQDFCANHSGTASVSKHLEEMANDRIRALQEQRDDMNAKRLASNEADKDLKAAAHESRGLIRHLRFSLDEDPANALRTALKALIEQSFTSYVDAIERDESELEKQIDKTTSETVREELKIAVKKKKAQKHALLRIRSLVIAVRDVQTLEALKHAPYITKAVYVDAKKLRKARDSLNLIFYQEVDAARDRTVKTDKTYRSDYRRNMRSVSNNFEKLEAEIRKRAQLNLTETLGRSGEDSRRIDAIIDDDLVKAREEADTALSNLLGAFSAARSAPTGNRKLLKPAVRSRSSVAIAPKPRRTSTPRRSLHHEIVSLKKKIQDPSAFANTEERHAAAAELDRLTTQDTQHQIAALNTKKQTTSDPSNIKKMDANLRALSRKVAASSLPTPASQATPATPATPASRRSRMKIMMGGQPRRNGIRRASTSTKQSDFRFGGQRHMHDAFDGAPYRHYDQTEVGNHADLSTFAQNRSAMRGNSSYGVNGESSVMNSERSAAKPDVSESAPSSLDQEETSDHNSTVSEHDTQSETTSETAAGNMASSTQDPQMLFQIPQADLRSAITASPSSSAAFWKYSMYKDSEGRAPSRHYCTNYEQTEVQAAKFLNEKIIGFDIEWEMGAQPGKTTPQRCVSLVQIAAGDKIGLFHIGLFKGSKPTDLVPPSLRRLMESPDIIKAGVNIGGDATRIENCLDVKMHGLFELSHLYKVVMFSEKTPKKVDKVTFNLAAQVQNILHLPLAKGVVRTSAWSRKLDNQQVEYAASDAYAGLRLFDALERKRKLMVPMPPRPAFQELKQPLVLGNGHVVVRSRAAKSTKDGEAKVVEDGEEGDEFFDALEEQEPDDATAEMAAEPSVDSQIAYPDLPQLDQLSIADETAVIEKVTAEPRGPVDHTSDSLGPKAKHSSPEKTEADQWATAFRANLESEGRKPAASPSNLRAYYLWHRKRCDLKRTAALLKNPPLLLSTVVSYIMEAVSKEKLEYDVERMREVVENLPKGVRWRYAAIVERVESA